MKKALSLILCLALCLSLLPASVMADGAEPSGSGTESDPYLITTADELVYLAEKINSGETTTIAARLENDIVFNDGVFDENGAFTATGDDETSEPREWTVPKRATVYFDGNGKSISGLYITQTSSDGSYSGLFSFSEDGYIKDLTIKDSFMNADGRSTYAGLFSGYSFRMSFTNCTAENNIIKSSGATVGSICGRTNEVSFDHVSASGSVSGSGSLGGLSGHTSKTTFKNCWNSATITNVNRNPNRSGGIVGEGSSSNFYNCANLGSIVTGGEFVGGIVGYASVAQVKNCYSLKDISGSKYWDYNYSTGVGTYLESTAVLVGTNSSTVVAHCFTQKGSDLYDVGSGQNIYVTHFDDSDELLSGLNDNLYKMDGEPGLSLWEMDDGSGYPLPTGSEFEDDSVYYDLWLDGVRVGERNKDDILENGLASYDSENKILCLHDGLVLSHGDSSGHSLLRSGVGDITVYIDGSIGFNAFENLASGPSVIFTGSGGGSITFKAAEGESAVVEIYAGNNSYGISTGALTLDGDIKLSVNTSAPCFAFCYTITLTSPLAVLDAVCRSSDGSAMLNPVSSVALSGTPYQKLYEGKTGEALTEVSNFTKKIDGVTRMYSHIRIAPEVYGLADSLPDSLTVSMAEANDAGTLKVWAEGELTDESITGIEISGVTPAEAGTFSKPDGADGSFTAAVTLSKDGASVTKTIPGTITASAFVSPEVVTTFRAGRLVDGSFVEQADCTFTYGDSMVFALTYTENGEPVKDLTGRVEISGQRDTYEFAWDEENGCYLTESAGVSAPGTYSASFDIFGTEHAEKTGTISGLTVEKRTPTAADFTFTAPESLVYDGDSRENPFSYPSDLADGGVSISIFRDGEEADAICEPGLYTFSIDVSEGTYYKGASGITNDSWTFTIVRQAASAAEAPQAKALTYLGAYQELVTAGTAEGGTLMYRLGDSGSFSDKIPSAENAGTYYVYWYVKGDGTHGDSEVQRIEAVISPLSLESVTVMSPPDVTYNGSDAAYDITFKYGIKRLNPVEGTDYTVSKIELGESEATSIVGAGTYTLTLTGKGNYTGQASITLVVTPKSITSSDIAVTAASGLVYTGSELDPSPAVYDSYIGEALTAGVDYTLTYAPVDGTGAALGETGLPKNAGSYVVTIAGIGNFTGSRTENVTVSPKDISDDDIFPGFNYEPDYRENPDNPLQNVLYGGMSLTEGVDYTVEYAPSSENASLAENGLPKNAGDYVVTITGIGNFTGSRVESFTIFPRSISGYNAYFEMWGSLRFSPGGVSLIYRVVVDGNPLTEGTDYTITLAPKEGGTGELNSSGLPWAVGSYTVTATGIGNYKDSVTREFAVTPNSLSDESITVTLASGLVYTGSELDPSPAVSDSALGEALTAGADYTLTYAPVDGTGAALGETGLPKNAGTYVVTVTGIGVYTDSTTKNVTVSPKSIADADVTLTLPVEAPYSDSPIDPKPVLTFGGVRLAEGVDYTIEYTAAGENAALDANGLPINAGNYLVSLTGIGNFTGSRTESFTVSPKNIADADVTVDMPESLRFSSGGVSPECTVTAFGRSLTGGTDYTVAFAPKSGISGGKLDSNGLPYAIGSYVVTITGAGNFTGTRTQDFSVTRIYAGGSHDHIYGPWQYDEAEHWKECERDGAVGKRGSHADVDGDGKCDVCGYSMPRAESTLPFTDVSSGDWFYDDVRYVYEQGLMQGVGGSTFLPGGSTTRAMIVTILYRHAGSPETAGKSTFDDVQDGAWYYDAVRWAQANGIVTGYSASSFGPNDEITREQLVAILYRYARYLELDVSESAPVTGFSDAGDVSGYAVDSMQWALAAGLVKGNGGKLTPAAPATRAQAASLIHRLCGLAEK